LVRWRVGLVLLALMFAVGAYIYQSRTRSAQPAPEPLVPCTTLNTVFLAVRSLDLAIELERSSATAEWRLTRPQPSPADASRVAGLMTHLHAMVPQATIEHPERTGYGLEAPHLFLTCRVKDGASYNLSVGDRSLDRSGYYVRKSDDSRVFVISATPVEAFNQSLTEPPLPRSPAPVVTPSPTR
jgi:hypothetical protein